MKTIISFQFGHVYQRQCQGFVLLCRVYKNPCYLWATEVKYGASLGVKEPLLEGFVWSTRPSQFWIGLPDATYRITATFYDPAKDRGPFTIKDGDNEVVRDVTIAAGIQRQESFLAHARNGVLRLEFAPDPGQDFLINALVVDGPSNAVLQPIFQTAPPTTLPDRFELARHAEDDPERALCQICDWLIDHQRSDGFLGDMEGGVHSLWYTASMPVRALLAGFDVLGERKYLEAALTVLDLFVSEQLPNGAWTGTMRGKPTAELAEAELQRILTHERQPMSDIGSVVTSLAVGSRYAPPTQNQKYIQAVEHYCTDWALRFQQVSGGFSDGKLDDEQGTMLMDIYSCATAIEAATFSLAHALTNKSRYLKVASDAIRFLLADLQDDGRMIGRGQPHWVVRSRKPFCMEPLYFGDLWYYDEGLITTAWHCPTDSLRHRINEAIGQRVFGSHGLLKALNDEVWWPIQDTWSNAKSAGMPQTLLYAKACGMTSPELEEALDNIKKFLCTPQYSQRIGVMVEDKERPASRYGYQTWSGMRMEATGFAGMTLAEMINPGVLYLAQASHKQLAATPNANL